MVFFASMSTLSVIGTEFVPQEDRGEFAVNIEVPPGTAFEQTVAHVEDVEKVVKEHAGSAADLLDGRLRRQPAQGVAARQGRQEARA